MPAIGFGLGIAPGGGSRQRGYDFTGGALPPGASLVRASSATVEQAGGVIATVAADVARFAAGGGLILEDAATNLILNGTGVGGAQWSVDASGEGAIAPAAVSVAAAAPDGGPAARLTFTRGSSFSRTATLVSGVTIGAEHVFSIWLRHEGAGGAGPALRLDAEDGGAVNLTPAWQRYAFARPAGVDPLSAQLLTWVAIPATPAGVTLLAWGAQVEAGSEPSSTIATAGAGGARAADRLTLDWGRQGLADGVRGFRYDLAGGGAITRTATVTGGMAEMPPAPPGRVVLRICVI